MKNSDSASRRAPDARALTVALAVADKAGWSLTHAGPVLSVPFAGYLYVDTAQLLLVPTSAELAFATRLVDGAVREARADALVVSTAGESVTFALALWASTATRWQVPITPCLDAGGRLWMVTGEPATSDAAPAGTAFPLLCGRTVDRPAPWPIGQRADGKRRAAAWLKGVMS